MGITTNHQYIDQYPIKSNSRKLIIGTMHPHLTEDFKIDFFYGNKGSFWDILDNAFPRMDFNSKDTILSNLEKFNVSISDMIRSCDRENAKVTADSDLYNLNINTEQIRDGIVNSEIDTIFFTSRFGRNNAAKLFVDAFKIKYDFDKVTNEFEIPKDVFGRPIKGVVLYSPSNNANIGISNSKAYKSKKDKYSAYSTPVKQFKIDFYREKFSFFNL